MTLALLKDVTQPLIVAISIMCAALLVRLNRGMPTLDWQSLEPAERKVLTYRVLELSREYMSVLALQFLTLFVLLALSLIKEKTFTGWANGPTVVLAFVGSLLGLCLSRMGYIVWRDTDIVRLQKKLIDESADRQAIDKASKEALETVNTIRSSALKETSKPEVVSWPDTGGKGTTGS
ncbi:hypothetical protein DYI24_19095 [Rhodopseudomonas sp. BR0C11]|uniref:hypothetical protein n=1 Tax=Rhodopseudomonas sp. BR0C11 TaxID=2269370 RepID=UPI0013E088B2|nr:hypothetical protein [Rhodopseudomonas sp. BR0C11]NEV79143.1 hypothetical protein [Rhodopseudomonas sp. BR0C11]